MSPGHIVCDSDDSDGSLSPLSSPTPSPVACVELPDAADASTSTDPSFFRDVYEEQGNGSPEPIDHGRGKARRASAKRKSGVLSISDGDDSELGEEGHVPAQTKMEGRHGGGSPEPAWKRRKHAAPSSCDTAGGRLFVGGAIEVSIPLQPVTPTKAPLHRHLSSSAATASTQPQIYVYNDDDDRHHGDRVNEQPSGTTTLSTVAFTTPSLFASSDGGGGGGGESLPDSHGDRGGGGDPSTASTRRSGRVHGTPRRWSERTPLRNELMSSPDIISEPLPLPGRNGRHQNSSEGSAEQGSAPRFSLFSESTTAERRKRKGRENGMDEEVAGEEDPYTIDVDEPPPNSPAETPEKKKAAKSKSKSKSKSRQGKKQRGRPKKQQHQARQDHQAAGDVDELEMQPQAQTRLSDQKQQTLVEDAEPDEEKETGGILSETSYNVAAPVKQDGEAAADPTTEQNGALASGKSGQQDVQNEERGLLRANSVSAAAAAATASTAKSTASISSRLSLGPAMAFRVGLSKRTKIAPLLKSLRK